MYDKWGGPVRGYFHTDYVCYWAMMNWDRRINIRDDFATFNAGGEL